MTAPDPWDECIHCGHDRDDHHPGGCDIYISATAGGIPTWRHRCDCRAFQEEAS